MRRIPPFLLALLLVAHFGAPLASAEERDTDGDGIIDALEDVDGNNVVDEGETNPLNADTDRGGEADGSEIRAQRNPLEQTDDLTFDFDGDGWVNGTELLRGSDWKKADTDDDGVNDPEDPFPLDPVYKEDGDEDGIPDEWERTSALGTMTGQTLKTDADNDGLSNEEELRAGTDPVLVDTDMDGVSDAEEIGAETDPLENACLSYAEMETVFDDTSDHWAMNFIASLSRTRTAPDDEPVIRGYDDGSGATLFLPDREITRFEFLKMVLLSSCTTLAENSLDVPIRFSDVLSVPAFEESADAKLRRRVVYTAVSRSIVQGYPDGTFKPDATINRAEALKIIIIASHITAPEEATNMSRLVTDVKDADWFKPYVSVALWHEIVSGYDDGTFKPAALMTRAEASKMIYLAMTVNPYVNGYVLPELK